MRHRSHRSRLVLRRPDRRLSRDWKGYRLRQPQIRNIAPDDIIGIDRHAIFGDRSAREVDFTKVSLGDPGGSLQRFAAQDGTSLNSAIAQARESGEPVHINIRNIRAGGGQGGRTGNGQIGGIGRFAVNVSGTVTADGTSWSMSATVTGVPDRQDYPPDDRRGSIAGPVNDVFGAAQRAAGGQDYTITFTGSQRIRIDGGCQ